MKQKKMDTNKSGIWFSTNLCSELERAIGHRYKIHTELGSGAYTTVLGAESVSDSSLVAIKIPVYSLLYPSNCPPSQNQLDSDRNIPLRIDREADFLFSISHPNIVARVEYHNALSGRPLEFLIESCPLDAFLILEYVEGNTLGHLIAEQQRIPLKRATSIILQLSDALAQVHKKGFTHSDLSTSNVMAQTEDDGSELVKLIDFGNLRLGNMIDPLYGDNCVIGTTNYIAPEYMQTGRPSVQSDIYSLACIYYEMLIGEPVFNGTTSEVRDYHISSPVQTEKLDAFPLWVKSFIIKNLDKDPAKRDSTASSLGDYLFWQLGSKSI